MNNRYLDERRQDQRHSRFSMALGAAVAVAAHAALIWGPRATYRPVLEEAKLRRVIVARPAGREAPPPPVPRPERVPPSQKAPVRPPEPTPPPPRPQERPPLPPEASPGRPAEPLPSAQPLAREAGEPAGPEVPRADGGADLRKAPPATAGPAAAKVPGPEAGGNRPGPERAAGAKGKDAWSSVLADLASRGRVLEGKEAEWGRRGGGGGAGTGKGGGRGEGGAGGGRGGDTEGYLDPRIRASVVSYPPAAIDQRHPPIPYPDLRFHKKELKSGICRVYYRVFTDKAGRIARTQIKTPETPADLQRYAPFVDAVVASVKNWPFEAREAEIHIDVLFEIE